MDLNLRHLDVFQCYDTIALLAQLTIKHLSGNRKGPGSNPVPGNEFLISRPPRGKDSIIIITV